MKELKTLKDLSWIGVDGDEDHTELSGTFISEKELKTEAIKWVKDREERLEEYDKRGEISEMQLYHKAEIDWIKHFFNLEEEKKNEQQENN